MSVKPIIFFASRNATLIFVILSFSILAVSCKPAKSISYFQNIQKDSVQRNIINKEFDLKIQKNDQLSIGVISVSLSLPENSGVFSPVSTYVSSGGSSTFLVDPLGYIQYPKLGSIKVEGLTRNELRDLIYTGLKPYLKDPVITVTYANQRIIVLGEVAKPGVVMMPEEKLTLFEVLGQSGDLTVYGKRDNILIIRDSGDARQFKRVSLEKGEIFTSPYYYLKPNDVVYVEPSKLKFSERRQQTQQIISYALSAITVILLVVDRLIR